MNRRLPRLRETVTWKAPKGVRILSVHNRRGWQDVD
jgi:hypothetical protein